MRLEQDAIDLLEVDCFGAVADGLQQGAETQVLGAAEHAFGRADDETERIVGEGGVSEGDLIEFAADEVREAIWSHFCIKTE